MDELTRKSCGGEQGLPDLCRDVWKCPHTVLTSAKILFQCRCFLLNSDVCGNGRSTIMVRYVTLFASWGLGSLVNF